jgi:PIN domain nuclease of toxin-antitoxin system
LRLLLDTNALLWVLLDDPSLSKGSRAVLTDNDSTTYVSAASLWEIAIKQSIGKLKLPGSGARWLIPTIEAANIELLSVTPEHAVQVAELPWHHRDPFDRLIIAQAMSENLIVVTRDGSFSQYGLKTIPA